MGRVSAARGFAGSSLALAILLGAARLPAQPGEPVVFTSEVRLVTLPVTVKDASGAPLGDLAREDFQIVEEGESRELAFFERRTDRLLSMALMLDTSLSTAIELRYERESARRFLAGLLGPGSHPGDSAAVFSFSADVEALQWFSRDLKALERALGRVRPDTGTSAYDAFVLASQELVSREGRRVIVAITDGGDTTSRWTFADALRAAHDAEVAIYPLVVVPIQADAGRNRGGEHALITLAAKTGGEAFVQHGAQDLDESFGQILRSLRTQYLLGFYPRIEGSASKELFRDVEVRVARDGAAVFSRSGYYFDPGEGTSGSRRAPTALRPMPGTKGPTEDSEASDKDRRQGRPKGSPDGRPRPGIVRP